MGKVKYINIVAMGIKSVFKKKIQREMETPSSCYQGLCFSGRIWATFFPKARISIGGTAALTSLKTIKDTKNWISDI